jgi:hypothetical protein
VAPSVFLNSFDGLDNTDNGTLSGFTVTPPDPQLAAGPNHIVEMVNIIGRIYDKKGGQVSSFTLSEFFGVPEGYLDTDPKVIYDAPSGHWFASYVSYRNNVGIATDFGRLHIAVSVTDDPTGAWNRYYLAWDDLLPDYAAIGVSDDKVTLSANIFDVDNKFLAVPCAPPYGYCGEQTVVIEKSQLIAVAASVATTVFPLDSSSFTVRPAHSLSAVSDQYAATFDLSADLPSTHLTLTRISGTPALANVTRTVVASPAIQPQDSPPLSQTAGGGTIDSGDFRLLELTYRDGTLWAAAGDSCIPSGDSATRSCLHLMQLDAASGALLQDIVYGETGEYYSWPAIRTDASGGLLVSFTHTNSATYAETVAAGRLASDSPNTLSPMVVLQAGSAVHTSGRWGDYMGAAVDPVNPACIWLVGEYAKSTSGADWGTHIGSVGYGGCDSDADGWAGPADNCPAVANATQADADSDGVGDACDNCPSVSNANQANQDGDEYGDACEQPQCVTVINHWVVPNGDSDCDGYPDSVLAGARGPESFITTDAALKCAATPAGNDEPLPDAWPVDFNDNQLVNGQDILSYNYVFGQPTTNPPVEIPGQGTRPVARWDLNASGLVNGADILQFNPFFGKRCAP